jgi:hypothetical protein
LIGRKEIEMLKILGFLMLAVPLMFFAGMYIWDFGIKEFAEAFAVSLLVVSLIVVPIVVGIKLLQRY